MKIIEIMQWEGANVAVALCYADASTDLGTKVNEVTLAKGSLAYLANGDVYVLGTTWTKIGE